MSSDPKIPWDTGMKVGHGWKSVTGTFALYSAVEYAPDNRKEWTPSGSCDHYMIDSAESLKSALTVSASLTVNAGGFNASGEGKFLKQHASFTATKNFVVRVTCKRIYSEPLPEPKFSLLPTVHDASDFYEAYGDYYIAEAEEGQSFLGIMSITANKTEDIQHIDGQLKLAFNYVQASGSGEWDSSELRQMASISSTMRWEGADVEITTNCTPEEMLKAAVKFKKDAGNPDHRPKAMAVLKKYLTVKDVAKIKNWRQLTDVKSQFFVKKEFDVLANDVLALDYLQGEIQNMKSLVESDEGSYEARAVKGFYAVSKDGMDNAIADIDHAKQVIKRNGELLTLSPFAESEKDKDLDGKYDKTYQTAEKIKARLPVEVRRKPMPGDSGAVGTSISACQLMGLEKPTVSVAWQNASWDVVAGTWTADTWESNGKVVASKALPRTPIANISSTDGKTVSVFYITSEGTLVQRDWLAGSEDWVDGDISSVANLPKPHAASGLAAVRQGNGDAWVFFQSADLKLVYVRYTAKSKTWLFPDTAQIGAKLGEGDTEDIVTMPPGASIAAAIMGLAKNLETDKETICILFQDGALKIRDLRCVAEDAPKFSYGEPRVGPNMALPLMAPIALCNVNSNILRAIIGSRERKLTVHMYDGKTWTQAGVSGASFHGACVATVLGDDKLSRIFTQSQTSFGINEFAWDGTVWKVQGLLNRLRSKQPTPPVPQP
ncbi:hypothetical protein EsH8_V_001157 [Colletotrichum jinshuiense]